MYNQIVIDFINELKNSNNPVEDLKKESIVSNFIKFASKSKNYNEEFVKEYNALKDAELEGEKLENFIYRDILWFYSDPVIVYSQIKTNLREALSILSKYKEISVEKRREIKKQLNIDKELYELEYSKYEFYINYYVDRIKAVEKEMDESNLIKRALMVARTPPWSCFSWMNMYSLYNLKDYNLMNGQDYIWFGNLSIREMQRMRFLRKNDHNEYLVKFSEMINYFNIKNLLIRKCEDNYYLYKRLNIIKSAVGIFERKEYGAFCYLIAPQTEGMFGDYLKICNVEFENKAGMSVKVEKVNEYTPVGGDGFLEYAYFRYDFPALRNPMAHGVMVSVDNETAFELLMDAYWVMNAIDSDKHAYKKWVNLLRKITSSDNACEIIIEKLRFDNIDYKSNKEVFISWINGDFNQIIGFYDLLENERILIDCLNSDKLYNYIWYDKDSQDKSEGINESYLENLNEAPLLYQDFVELVREKFTIPPKWLADYYSFIEIMNNQKEKTRIIVNKILENFNNA